MVQLYVQWGFLFIPLITEIIYNTGSWQSYAVPILLYLIVGGSLVITNKNVDLKISPKEAFIITVLSWVLMTFLCAVPFIYTKVDLIVDALFESMSGITTTGATTLNNIEIYLRILIWKAFTMAWGYRYCRYSTIYFTLLESEVCNCFILKAMTHTISLYQNIFCNKIFIIYFTLTIVLIFLLHFWYDYI